MTGDPIGAALRSLVPEPPAELTLARLTVARAAHRRHRAAVRTVAVLAVLAVVLPVTLLTVRLVAAPTATAPTRLVTTRISGLLVTHPATWAYRPTENSAAVVEEYLSTEPIEFGRCATPDPGDEPTAVCSAPTPALGRDGVLVALRSTPFTGTGGAVPPGWTPTVHVRDGVLLACRSPGSELHLQASVSLPGGPAIQADACVRGPHLDRTRAELAAVLASVRPAPIQ